MKTKTAIVVLGALASSVAVGCAERPSDPDDAVPDPTDAPDGTAAALELGRPEVWVSAPEVTAGDGRLTATADFVPPAAKPFPLDPAEVRLTLIGPEGAVEYQGCDPA